MKRILPFILLLIPLCAGAQRHAVVNLSVNYMRAMPDYESALETQNLMGTPVEIIAEDGYWRQIVSPEPYTAWATNLGLVEMTAEQIKEYIAADKYIFTDLYGHVSEEPSKTAGYVCDLVEGDLLLVTREGGRPLRRNGFLGVTLPSGKTGWVPKRSLQDFREWAESRQPTFRNIFSTARQFLGTPYLWGGESSKGLDCSGLIRYSYFLNGVLLPRNGSQMINVGQDIPALKADGSINFEAFRPGDVLCFGKAGTGKVTHVGMYIGNNSMIHSSKAVRISHLSDPSASDFYDDKDLLFVRRFLGHVGEPGITSILSSPAYFPQ